MARFTKASCNAAGLSCSETLCRVKRLRRRLTSLSFACNVTRKLSKIMYQNTLYYRPLSTLSVGFRHITTLPALSVCDFLKPGNMIPLLRQFIVNFFRDTPDDIPKCPFKVGDSLHLTNFTELKPENVNIWPSGEYKTYGRFFNDEDDNILSLYIYATLEHSKGKVF